MFADNAARLSQNDEHPLATPKHYHSPPTDRARCPVCHEAVYSRAGIHPQCAVSQYDPVKTKKGGTPPKDVEAVLGADEPVVDPDIVPLATT